MKKKCSKCQNLKDFRHFYKNKSSSDGLDHYCKECNKKRMDIYFKTKKGKIALKRAIKKYMSKYWAKKRNET